MSGTVKVQQMTVDGAPYTCPECDSHTFTLDGHPVFDALPAIANCDFSHHWDDSLITGDTLVMIRGSRTGRPRAHDEDTFDVTHNGIRFEGTLVPELVYDDLRQAGRIYWKRIIKPTVRKKKRAALRTLARPGKQAARKARDAASATKAATIAAAWTAQTGGYQDDADYQSESVIPCGAGCTDGYFPLDTHIHGAAQVRCSVCHGTGETL
jgi:hypothetical protein